MNAERYSRNRRWVDVAAACALIAIACTKDNADAAGDNTPALPPGMQPRISTNADAQPPAVPFDPATPRVLAHAIKALPHDTAAYTQGFEVHRGAILESIGREGASEVRELSRTGGVVGKRAKLPPNEFGEGLAEVGNRIYQLTWRGGRGHVYDATSLAVVDSFTYDGEGWGLASDGHKLFMSDGTSSIREIDPQGFRTRRTFQVTEGGKPVYMLNELEVVGGSLWANIYQTDFIARIDPATGKVQGWIDVSGLLTAAEKAGVTRRGGVANGIALDSATNRVLLTGKLWPKMFEIDLRAVQPAR